MPRVTRTRRTKRMITITVIRRMIMIMITAMVMTMRTNTTTIIITTSIVVTTTAAAIPMLMKANEPVGSGQTGLNDSEASALYRLMTWLSPSFPVGAFSYSSGIEWAVEAGDVSDAASLRDWLTSMLVDGAGVCDGIFLVQAHRSSGNPTMLAEIAELAAAFVPSRERQLEMLAQGRAFIETARAAWPAASLDRLVESCNGPIAYPVAVGIVSTAHHIPLAPVLHAFLHALTSNWISAAARLVPLGQTDGQRLLALLEPVVMVSARRAL